MYSLFLELRKIFSVVYRHDIRFSGETAGGGAAAADISSAPSRNRQAFENSLITDLFVFR